MENVDALDLSQGEAVSAVASAIKAGDAEVAKKAVNMISGLKAKTYTEKLKELNLLSLADRRTRFDVI